MGLYLKGTLKLGLLSESSLNEKELILVIHFRLYLAKIISELFWLW